MSKWSQPIGYCKCFLPEKKPAQEEKVVANEIIVTYYEFLRKEIVEIEFVKDEEGIYKKRALPKDFQFTLKLVDVIDENNIDKDKVKTVK